MPINNGWPKTLVTLPSVDGCLLSFVDSPSLADFDTAFKTV